MQPSTSDNLIRVHIQMNFHVVCMLACINKINRSENLPVTLATETILIILIP